MLDGKPRIKLSENLKKMTLPHKKQVYRILNNNHGFFGADVITGTAESTVEIMHHPFEPDKSLVLKGLDKEPLLHEVMRNGALVGNRVPLKEIASYCQQRLKMVPEEHKRFYNPHIYKVGISEKLREERNMLRAQYKY